jgi:enamine deaminase RidA (YjgF/YER057c/UK114 family)
MSRDKYGFSDACIIDNRLIVIGQTGMDPLTKKSSPNVEDQIAQAFNNVNDLIIHTLTQEGHAIEEGRNGWDYVVKLRAFFVGLSGMRVKARENMVHSIKNWCPHH